MRPARRPADFGARTPGCATQLGAAMPPLAPIGRALAGFGVTAVTDASVSTDSAGAAHLGDAVRAGDLPLRLTLMSGGPLQAPADGAFAVGPVKILLDDHALPPLEQMVETIGRARAWRRPVAVHCVTAGELAVTLAAFDAAGARPGDRIEHGGVISASAIGEIRRLGLTVVTQPAFVEERGDRYLADVEKDELGRPLPLRQPDGGRRAGGRQLRCALRDGGPVGRDRRGCRPAHAKRPSAGAGRAAQPRPGAMPSTSPTPLGRPVPFARLRSARRPTSACSMRPCTRSWPRRASSMSVRPSWRGVSSGQALSPLRDWVRLRLPL